MMDASSVKILDKKLSPILYKNLVIQLNRDLLLGGISFKIELSYEPKDLVLHLNKLLKSLVQNDYQAFNQFMYTLDVSESKIHNLKQTNLELLALELTQLVLERLLQKVILKEQFKS